MHMSSASPWGIGPRTYQGDSKLDGEKLTISPKGGETKQDKISLGQELITENYPDVHLM